MSEKAYKIMVSGHVQGVGYRFYCRDIARQLGLAGFVMNLPDGKVEIEVYGDENKIKEFISEITRRDRSFIVEDLKKEEIDIKYKPENFEIKFY
jgi:acylphosphatase